MNQSSFDGLLCVVMVRIGKRTRNTLQAVRAWGNYDIRNNDQVQSSRVAKQKLIEIIKYDK